MKAIFVLLVCVAAAVQAGFLGPAYTAPAIQTAAVYRSAPVQTIQTYRAVAVPVQTIQAVRTIPIQTVRTIPVQTVRAVPIQTVVSAPVYHTSYAVPATSGLWNK